MSGDSTTICSSSKTAALSGRNRCDSSRQRTSKPSARLRVGSTITSTGRPISMPLVRTGRRSNSPATWLSSLVHRSPLNPPGNRVRHWLLRLDSHVVDACPGRAAPTPRYQRLYSLRRSLEHRLDSAVGAVAHPPGDVTRPRTRDRRVPEADSLDTATNRHVYSLNLRRSPPRRGVGRTGTGRSGRRRAPRRRGRRARASWS